MACKFIASVFLYNFSPSRRVCISLYISVSYLLFDAAVVYCIQCIHLPRMPNPFMQIPFI